MIHWLLTSINVVLVNWLAVSIHVFSVMNMLKTKKQTQRYQNSLIKRPLKFKSIFNKPVKEILKKSCIICNNLKVKIPNLILRKIVKKETYKFLNNKLPKSRHNQLSKIAKNKREKEGQSLGIRFLCKRNLLDWKSLLNWFDLIVLYMKIVWKFISCGENWINFLWQKKVTNS